MAKRIPVSFKENSRDDKLYAYVINEGDKSYFVKNAIEFYINHLNSKSTPVTAKSPLSDSINFEGEEDGIGEILGLS
jgi:hypothetical protein